MTTKLIRDGIPHIAAARGQHLDLRIADRSEMTGLLKAKLIEELADVLEVVHALTVAAGFTAEQLQQARTEKAERRGGFTRGVVLRTERAA